MADDDAKVLAEAAKLPMEERATHSNWKVRSAAYESMKDTCAKVFSDSDPVLSAYAPLFPKACADGNAAALDKALEALTAFLAVAGDQLASKIAGKTSSNIVAKALGARPATAQRGTDALLAFIEVEQADKVVAALIEGYSNKVPKNVVGTLDVTLLAIRAFGAKVVPANTVLKALPPLFESKDAKARDKVKEIVAELARWMGADLIRAAMYDKMRDAMKEDVDKLLQEAPSSRPRAERMTRKEQAKQATAAPAAAAEEGVAVVAAVVVEEEVPDSYEFAEPKDITKELNKEFWEGLASAKWLERKGALTRLKELAAYPRLAGGDFGDVNRELRKLITKDSNVNVVGEALFCTANLANGLRREYSGTARSLVSVVLEKLKDKSSLVVKAAGEALAAMNKHCFTLADVTEDVVAALGHQNPKVKELTLLWLVECVPRETKPALAKLHKDLLVAVVARTGDGAPAIREAALQVLTACALKAGSLAALDKVTAKMDEREKKKLEEQVMAAAKGGRPAPVATAPAASRASGTTSRPGSGGPSPQLSPRGAPPPTKRATKPEPARASTTSRPATAKAGVRASSAAAPSAGAAAAGGDNADDEGSLSSALMSKHEARERLVGLLGEEGVVALEDAAWKARLEGMDVVLAKANEADVAAEYCSVLVQAMQHIPGWEEKNFQVMAKAFEVIRVLATNASVPFGRREALVGVNGALDKLADIKLRGPAFELLLAASEAVGPQFVAALVHKRAVVHKNPKVLAEALNWLSQAIADFGLARFNVKSLLDWAKEDLGHSNAAVRTAAVSLMGEMHSFLGAPLGDMVRADVKPALMSAIEGEFGKRPVREGAFQAKRVSRAAVASSGGKPPSGASKSSKAAAAAAPEEPSLDELLPRTDLSAQISAQLLADLVSANWKERKAGLDEVDALLVSAGNRIQPSVGDLFGALKQRLADTNKNLVAQTLGLLGRIARAMGRPMGREGRSLLSPALKCLADGKPWVRAAVIEMLEGWVSVAAAEPLFEETAEAVQSPKVVGEGKQAALTWMASAITSGRAGPECAPAAVRAAAVGVGYKTLPVREAGTAVLAALVNAVGAAEAAAAARPLDKALSKTVLEALAKLGPGSGAGGAGSRPGTAASISVRASSNSAPTRPGTASQNGAGAASKAPAAGVRSSRAGAPVARSAVGLGGAAAAASASMGDDDCVLQMDRGKDERAKKARYKGNKFEIHPDEVAALETDLGPLASPALRALLFAKDFKKHCAAADMLKDSLNTSMDEAVSCLDLLLKWCVLRLAEGNTAALLSTVGFLKSLLDHLIEQGYRMSEHEAKTFLPGLVEKCGQPQPQLRADCRDLMRKACALYPPARVVTYVRDGLDSKNNRTRVSCAEEIGCTIEREGAKMYQGAKCDVVPALGRLVSDRDKDIRAACLAALEIVYSYEGEDLWRLLGRLTEQQKSIIEERLKYQDKELAKKGLKPGYRSKAGTESVSASVAAPSMAALHTAPAAALVTGGEASGRAALGSSMGSFGAGAYAGGTALGPEPGGGSRIGAGSRPGSALGGSRHVSDAGSGPSQSLLTQSTYSAPSSMLMSAYVPPPTATGATSSSAQPLSRASDASELSRDWERCMDTLRGGGVEEAVEVMKLLCYEMMDMARTSASGAQAAGSVGNSAVATLLASNADALVSVLAAKTDEIFSEASAAIRAGSAPNARACKYCLNTLMNVFSTSPALPEGVKEDTLKALTTTLLLRLVDDQLGRLPEGEALLKALNVLMLKVLENCNRSHSFAVLLGLLLQLPPQVENRPELEARWADLVVKCLIKITKALPATIESVDVSSLLFSIHSFFERLGVEEIRRRGAREDKPLRMVKTILHELCKLKGSSIYQYTGAIPATASPSALAASGSRDGKPIIFPYIDLNLQTLQSNGVLLSRPGPAGTLAAAGTSAGIAAMRPGSAAAGTTPGAAKAALLSRGAATPGAYGGTPGAALKSRSAAVEDPIKIALSEIFRKIGQKEHMEQALLELHQLQQQHPDVDVAQYMGDASDNFKAFIARSLAKVRDKLAAAEQAGNGVAGSAGSGAGSAGPSQQVAAAVGAERSREEGGQQLRGSWDAPAPDDQSVRVGSGSAGALGSGAAAAAGTPGSGGAGVGALRKSGSGIGSGGIARAATANMDQLRDRLKQIQGDISQLQAQPRPERSIQDLQARMQRLHNGTDSGS